MERFFKVYPDGRLISIVRDPKNWFPSALRHNRKIKKDKYSNIQMALDRWINNIEAMIRNHQLYQERMCIIKFEDLVLRTKRVMQHLCAFLGIEYDDILLVPTFNGAPIPPNSSFNDNQEVIIKKTAERYKTLSAKEIGVIEQKTGDIYHRVLERVTRV